MNDLSFLVRRICAFPSQAAIRAWAYGPRNCIGISEEAMDERMIQKDEAAGRYTTVVVRQHYNGCRPGEVVAMTEYEAGVLGAMGWVRPATDLETGRADRRAVYNKDLALRRGALAQKGAA